MRTSLVHVKSTGAVRRDELTTNNSRRWKRKRAKRCCQLNQEFQPAYVEDTAVKHREAYSFVMHVSCCGSITIQNGATDRGYVSLSGFMRLEGSIFTCML